MLGSMLIVAAEEETQAHGAARQCGKTPVSYLLSSQLLVGRQSAGRSYVRLTVAVQILA